MKSKEEIEQLAYKIYADGFLKGSFIHGYTQCQKDMALSQHKEVDLDETICRCSVNKCTKELHPCPYNADVNNDDTPICTCCENCQHECSMDI